ncbi:MAG: hypothetical protein PUP93_18420, partial [Rhizonema sp. NSF051]|nr:hypothetical protein [Rhizonema sp. NSF051]
LHLVMELTFKFPGARSEFTKALGCRANAIVGLIGEPMRCRASAVRGASPLGRRRVSRRRHLALGFPPL